MKGKEDFSRSQWMDMLREVRVKFGNNNRRDDTIPERNENF